MNTNIVSKLHPRRLGTLVMFLALFCAAAQAAQPGLKVQIDHPDGIYRSGETATFTLTLNAASTTSHVLNYSILRDGLHIMDQGTRPIGAEPVTISVKLDQPGHLILRAGLDDGRVRPLIGILFDPYEIKPGLPEEPEGFDEFWQRQRELVRRDPATPILEPIDSEKEGIEMYDVTIPMPEGPPVRGYFATPVGATPGTMPAVVYLHGAGGRSATKPAILQAAGAGMIAIEANAHGYDNGQPVSYYNEWRKQLEGDGVRYPLIGRESRESWYMLNMYRRALRALDFITARPEWDGRILVVEASSMGGAQTIAVAGLDPRVTGFVAYVPGMVDLGACEVGRIAGWPRPVPVDPETGRCTDPAILAEVRYFDGVHFMRRTRAEGFFSIGLIDLTCPATSIMAAVNQLPPERRQLLIMPEMDHTTPVALRRNEGFNYILQHVARMRRQAATQ